MKHETIRSEFTERGLKNSCTPRLSLPLHRLHGITRFSSGTIIIVGCSTGLLRIVFNTAFSDQQPTRYVLSQTCTQYIVGDDSFAAAGLRLRYNLLKRHVVPLPLSCGGSYTDCRSASVSTSNSETITFRAFHTGTPAYLACQLHRHQPPRHSALRTSCLRVYTTLTLRSGTTTTLHRPHASSDFHRHSFAVFAPAIWNNIPASIRDSGTLGTFRTALKTHLFNSAYVMPLTASDSLLPDLWRQPKRYM